MKEYIKNNKFGAISLGLILLAIIVGVLWLLNVSDILFIIELLLMLGAVILNILGLINDQRKILSILSIIIVVLLIIGTMYYFYVVLPKMVDVTVEGLLKSWGIGG